jgi:hypothetical protein
MGARKDDEGKLRYDLIPAIFMQTEAEVFTYGASKYGDNNWMEGGMGVDRLYAAAMRHIQAWKSGETNDPESGLPHMAHARWNLGAIMHFDAMSPPGLDDRIEIQADDEVKHAMETVARALVGPDKSRLHILELAEEWYAKKERGNDR